MSGSSKQQNPVGGFVITPHKVSVCMLVQVYAPPGQALVPYPFSSVAQHNRFGLYLMSLLKSCDNILEPKLEELMNQLVEIGGVLKQWLGEHLMHRLSSLKSADDLFTLFSTLRGVLNGPDMGVMVDDQIILDPNSHLGMFLRRCLLAFNLLSFEGVCRLLTNILTYCKGVSSTRSSMYPSTDEDDEFNGDLEESSECEDMDHESFDFEKVIEDIQVQVRARESFVFHSHAPRPLLGFVEDIQVFSGVKHEDECEGSNSEFTSCSNDDALGSDGQNTGLFLRTNWQVQGYLRKQADSIEKHASSFPLNAFESVLKQLQRLAPDLHRVHYLRYLNNLYHDDYPAALENLHCYFDYSAGAEGIDVVPSSTPFMNYGRYGTALLCLGMMHCHFGHPRKALQVLTEAVQISQQHNDDTCLSYTLAAICNLLSEVGISGAAGIIGSSCTPENGFGSLSVQQQLFVLLTRSLRRAERLNLTRLVASSRLAMARFDMTHVKGSLLSFGPKSSTKLKTCPANVFKELRLSSYLLSEFGPDDSSLTIDGAFCTTWLKDLQKPIASAILLQDKKSSKDCVFFQFVAQPNLIPGSILQLCGSSYLLRATAWELYGSAPLARLNALVHATCFTDASSFADAELAYIKLIQHLAVFKGYREALAALKCAEDKFLSLGKSQIQILKLQLLHEHALHLGHLKQAQRVCEELGALASSVTGVDLGLKSEASLRHARTLLADKQFSQAAAVTHSLFCMCYKFNLHVENATSLLLLAEIHKKSGNAVLGLPYALASLSFCQSFNLDLLEASATLTLTELWLSLGVDHAKRALTLIYKSLPMILGHGGLELRGRAHIAIAKCYFADPSFSVSKDSDVVLDHLRQASEDLQILEYRELAAESFYLMAIVFDKLGHLEEREEAAASFKKYILSLKNPQDEVDPLLAAAGIIH